MEARAQSEHGEPSRPNPTGPTTAGESVPDLSNATLPKKDGTLSVYDVLRTEEARQLDAVLASKSGSPIILALGTEENTQRFMRACLRGSYLFGREVVPSYLANVFRSLTTSGPPNDETGRVLRGLTDMCIGELSTNNIYGRPGESHAHFHDLYEAYSQAGGDLEEFRTFFRAANEHGTSAAVEESTGLWSAGAKRYAERLLEVCKDPLASFVLMPCNEILSTVIYPVAIAHMSNEPRFDKFRRFLEVHVQLDGDSHGDVALEWLGLYVRQARVPPAEVASAVKKVMALYQSERAP